MGFEPTKGVTLYTLSKRAPSTTRTPLRLNVTGTPEANIEVERGQPVLRSTGRLRRSP
jgi:hypothetical protein